MNSKGYLLVEGVRIQGYTCVTFPAIFYFFALDIPVLMFPGIISLNNIVPGIKFHCLSHPKLSIGHFRTVYEQKNGDEKAERNSLKFPLYKQRKMQICPLNLDFVLLFLQNSKVGYWILLAWKNCVA